MCDKCKTRPDLGLTHGDLETSVVDCVMGVPLSRKDIPGLLMGGVKTYNVRTGAVEEHALIYKVPSPSSNRSRRSRRKEEPGIANRDSISPPVTRKRRSASAHNIFPAGVPVLMRINSACYTGDIFHDDLCDCNWQLEEAFRMIAAHDGPGLVLYHFAHEGKAHGWTEKLKSYDGPRKMFPVEGDWRDFSSAVAILRHLGITHVSLMTNNPHKEQYMRDHGITIVDRKGVVASDPSLAGFYRFKAEEFGHDLPTDLDTRAAADQPADLGKKRKEGSSRKRQRA